MDVLLVEDLKVNQTVATLMLQKAGCKVTLAENGKEAVELYAEHKKFDMILMDIQMPIMDGYKAVEILRGTYKNLPPIIGISANGVAGEEEKYKSKGLDDFLPKPFTFEILYKKIFDWSK